MLDLMICVENTDISVKYHCIHDFVFFCFFSETLPASLHMVMHILSCETAILFTSNGWLWTAMHTHKDTGEMIKKDPSQIIHYSVSYPLFPSMACVLSISPPECPPPAVMVAAPSVCLSLSFFSPFIRRSHNCVCFHLFDWKFVFSKSGVFAGFRQQCCGWSAYVI